MTPYILSAVYKYHFLKDTILVSIGNTACQQPKSKWHLRIGGMDAVKKKSYPLKQIMLCSCIQRGPTMLQAETFATSKPKKDNSP